MAEDSLIEITIEDKASLRLGDVEEVSDFIKTEREHWSWVNENELRHVQMNPRPMHVLNILSNMERHNNAYASNPNNQNELNQLIAQCTDYVKRELLSSAPEGVFVKELQESEGPIVAVGALGQMAGFLANYSSQPNPEISNKLFHGAVTFSLFRSGNNKKSISSVRSSITKLMNQAKEKLKDYETENHEVNKELLEARSELIGTIDETKRLRRDHWKKFLKKASEDIEKSVDSIKNTESTYKEYMRLGASEGYWTEKQEAHKKEKDSHKCNLNFYIGFMFLFYIVISVVLLLNIASLAELKAQVLLLLTIFVALISTVIFWIFKILLKIYLNEMNLENEAKERVVMVRTYNALVHENKADLSDRDIILSALFRSSSGGLIQDLNAPDSSPISRAIRVLDNK